MTLDEIKDVVVNDREGRWTARTVIATLEQGRIGMSDDTKGLVERPYSEMQTILATLPMAISWKWQGPPKQVAVEP